MTDHAKQLEQRFAKTDATVAVLGLGYVGLPLAKLFHNAGFNVIGLDVDSRKTDMLQRGESYIEYLGEDYVKDLADSDRFTPSTDFDLLESADAIVICVPSPLGEHNDPDLSYVEATCEEIAPRLRPGVLVVLESTTYPGTTREVVLPRLEARGLTCGRDFFLAFSPEREDPANPTFTTHNTPKLIGGIDDTSGRVGAALYEQTLEKVVRVSTSEVAEAAKLLENIYRAVNIAMVNEMKVLLTEMDIDVWEVIQAASTKPFGFHAFYPGPGIGGHCIPVDPFYLTWKAKEVGFPTRFIELAGEVNNQMPGFVIRRLTEALSEDAKAVRDSNILVIGLAYKPEVSDVRESPALTIIEKLQSLGANVSYHDPHVPKTHKMRKHDLGMTSTELTPDALAAADAALIITPHAAIDLALIGEHAKLVVDTRNAMAKLGPVKARVVSA